MWLADLDLYVRLLVVAGVAFPLTLLVLRTVRIPWFRKGGRTSAWRRVLVASAIACAVVFARWEMVRLAYYMDLVENFETGDNEADLERAEDSIVQMGNRAIAPLLERTSGHRLFRRGTCLLAFPLKKLGDPAHRALIDAIDQSHNEEQRIGWIYLLCEDFNDFSRLDLWVDRAVRLGRDDVYLRDLIIRKYPDAPIISSNGEITSDFLEWWSKHKRSGVSLERR